MTCDEKREALAKFCDSQEDCDYCPCAARYGNCIVSIIHTASEEAINLWYDRVYPQVEVIEVNEVSEVCEVSEAPKDNVNHPSHYENGKMECIDAMIETQGKEAVQAFCVCNAFKYLWRHNNKNQLEDIKKAIWYLNKFIELEELDTKQ